MEKALCRVGKSLINNQNGNRCDIQLIWDNESDIWYINYSFAYFPNNKITSWGLQGGCCLQDTILWWKLCYTWGEIKYSWDTSWTSLWTWKIEPIGHIKEERLKYLNKEVCLELEEYFLTMKISFLIERKFQNILQATSMKCYTR